LLVGGSIAALAFIAACHTDAARIIESDDPHRDPTVSIPPPKDLPAKWLVAA
jgi:hypothetical protein